MSGAASGRNGALIDVFGRFLGRILQHLALRGGVQQVGVDRERGFAALVLGDRDLMAFGEFEQAGARGEVPFAPRRDDLDLRLQRVIGEFEAHLVVALAGGAMGHGIGADQPSDLDLLLGDQRAGNRGAEQIQPLIERVGPEHREDVLGDEFLAHILDEDVFRLDAEQFGLLARRLQLLALAEIGGEGHHLAAIGGLQPFQDHRGVETARIGEHNPLDVASLSYSARESRGPLKRADYRDGADGRKPARDRAPRQRRLRIQRSSKSPLPTLRPRPATPAPAVRSRRRRAPGPRLLAERRGGAITRPGRGLAFWRGTARGVARLRTCA